MTAAQADDPFVAEYRPLLFREGDVVAYTGTAPSRRRWFAGTTGHLLTGGWNTVWVSVSGHGKPVRMPTKQLHRVEPAPKPAPAVPPLPTGAAVEYVGTAPSVHRVFAGDTGVVINRRSKAGWAYVRPPHGLHTLPIKTRHLRVVQEAAR